MAQLRKPPTQNNDAGEGITGDAEDGSGRGAEGGRLTAWDGSGTEIWEWYWRGQCQRWCQLKAAAVLTAAMHTMSGVLY